MTELDQIKGKLMHVTLTTQPKCLPRLHKAELHCNDTISTAATCRAPGHLTSARLR